MLISLSVFPSSDLESEAKFLVPDRGDVVDSSIGLSYRPARLHMLAGRYDNPMPESTISPSQGLRIWPLDVGGVESFVSNLCVWHSSSSVNIY